MNRRALLRTAAGAVTATAALPRIAAAQTAPPLLRIAYQPYEYSAQVLYAQDQGFFAKAGVRAELQEIAFGAALATAVAAGSVDIGIATITTLAIGHAKKLPFVIVAPGAEFLVTRPPTGWLLVGNQTTIKTARDLAGKVVATPGLGTMGDYGVRAWMDANGGDSSTLKFIELPFSQMPAAFQSGRIDAAFLGEPFLSEAMKYAHPLAREMDALGREYVITAWFCTLPWAQANPDLVRRFADAMRDVSAWAPQNAQKCIDILARVFKRDPATIAPSALAVFPPRITPNLIANEIAMTARYGKFAPFPAEELIYTPR